MGQKVNWWTNQPKTLDEIEALPCEVLVPANVARVLCANPQKIHDQAVNTPEKLGFPVIIIGNRVKIPKQPFLKLMREGKHESI